MEINRNNIIDELIEKFNYRKDLKILLNKNDGRYFICINKVAKKFIDVTYEKKEYDKIMNELCKIFNVNEEIIKNDYILFIENIVKKKKNNSNVQVARGGIPEWINLKDIQFPLSIEIEITKRCNWNCEFCYNVWKYSKEKNNKFDLPLGEYKKIIDEAVNNGCQTVRISGGEPTLHPEFKKMIEYTANKGININLFTNASILKIEDIQFLKLHRVENVLISLHGTEVMHNKITHSRDGFNKTVEQIKLFTQNGMTVGVETILLGAMKDDELLELSELLEKINVKNWNLMPYVETGSEKDICYKIGLDRIVKLIKILKKKSKLNIRVVCSPKFCNNGQVVDDILNSNTFDSNCGAGVLWLSVSYDGKIRNCPHSDVYCGKISDGIKNVYLGKMKNKINNILDKPEDKCKECKAYNKCRGGCYLSKIDNY